MKLGIHTGPQDLTMEELLRVWKRADGAGFHWISVWDHFYANPLQSRENPCFEGVATMAALAAHTEHVRVGCLMFCALYRNPGLLVKSAVTIDHLSGGRVELGLGAGWFEQEFRDFGYAFPPMGARLDQLEEALAVTRSLLREPKTDFRGKHYTLEGAVCSPKPMNPGLRIWVGGMGARRTPRIAARFADGYNAPYVSPAMLRERIETIERECDRIGRDPAEIERSVNLHFRMTGRAGADPHGPTPPGGVLSGTAAQVIDTIGAYERAGAEGVNIAFRPPIDWDAFETYISEVLPAFA